MFRLFLSTFSSFSLKTLQLQRRYVFDFLIWEFLLFCFMDTKWCVWTESNTPFEHSHVFILISIVMRRNTVTAGQRNQCVRGCNGAEQSRPLFADACWRAFACGSLGGAHIQGKVQRGVCGDRESTFACAHVLVSSCCVKMHLPYMVCVELLLHAFLGWLSASTLRYDLARFIWHGCLDPVFSLDSSNSAQSSTHRKASVSARISTRSCRLVWSKLSFWRQSTMFFSPIVFLMITFLLIIHTGSLLVYQIVLLVGNYLNAGTANSSTYGFKLSALCQVSHIHVYPSFSRC